MTKLFRWQNFHFMSVTAWTLRVFCLLWLSCHGGVLNIIMWYCHEWSWCHSRRFCLGFHRLKTKVWMIFSGWLLSCSRPLQTKVTQLWLSLVWIIVPDFEFFIIIAVVIGDIYFVFFLMIQCILVLCRQELKWWFMKPQWNNRLNIPGHTVSDEKICRFQPSDPP